MSRRPRPTDESSDDRFSPSDRELARRFGRHLLKYPSDAVRIVSLGGKWFETHPANDRWIIEIGSGQGALTAELVRTYPHTNIVGVELERESARALRSQFAAEKRVSIVETDILRWAIPSHIKSTLIVGNLPYSISAPILDWTVRHRDRIDLAVYMLQREVAQRLSAGPGTKNWAPISIMTQLYFEIDLRFTLGPERFVPPPKVDSSVVTLLRRDLLSAPPPPNFERVVRAGFAQRRKLLRKNLVAGLGLSNARAVEVMELVNLGENARAEEMSISSFISLAKALAPSP